MSEGATAKLPERIHIIGVAGRHMSAIARVLKAWGHDVRGSDQRSTPLTQELEALGVRIYTGHKPEQVGNAQLVVFTSAARQDNVEMVEAHQRGIEVIKRDEMVARMMQGRFGVAVAGAHGKTTTSSLMAHMLVEAGLDPMYLIGGIVRSLGVNAAPGSGRYIVVEADEYDRAFLAYHPDVAVVTNIDPDHLDVFGTIEEMQRCFAEFMGNVPESGHIVACTDSPRVAQTVAAGGFAARDIRTYGLDAGASWRAHSITQTPEGQQFEVECGGTGFGAFTIALPGRHNVSNALAGIVAGNAIGLETPVIRRALATFRGAVRRFEYVDDVAGVMVMDDYSHHPTEIRAMVETALVRFPDRRLVVLFQPNTFSRNKYLHDEWRRCFEGVDTLYVSDTYAARETPEAGRTSEQLIDIIETPRAVYAGATEEAAAAVAEVLRPGDVFFTVGSGDIDRANAIVIERLRSRGA